MKIYHLYHSGVAVVINDNLLIFDYYQDRLGRGSIEKDTEISLSRGVVREDVLKRYKNIYVFVSHRHGDHYNPVIFDWLNANKNIKYILSYDIKKQQESENVISINKDEYITIDGIDITAYGSTDQGISFLVDIDGYKIFHAGDLNWWAWDSFSREQLMEEEDDFKSEVNRLSDRDINIAFVPVDPRLNRNYFLAGEYFINQIKPDLFIPIHFGDRYSISKEFAEQVDANSTRVAIVKKRGEEIEYDE